MIEFFEARELNTPSLHQDPLIYQCQEPTDNWSPVVDLDAFSIAGILFNCIFKPPNKLCMLQ